MAGNKKMPNDWFQFKQFRIGQARSAMRVCTDSCLFGAIVAQEYSRFLKVGPKRPLRMLDIGSGTGLLSLMLAQKSENSHIVGIEPHEGSFQDAQVNFDSSPWPDRLTLFNQSLEDFLKNKHDAPFDLIIANPPFFKRHLPSPKSDRNVALHSTKNLAIEWLSQVSEVVDPDTQLWFLLPGPEARELLDAASKTGFSLFYMHDLHQKKTKNWRSILGFSISTSAQPMLLETYLYDESGVLNLDLKRYLSDYYL